MSTETLDLIWLVTGVGLWLLAVFATVFEFWWRARCEAEDRKAINQQMIDEGHAKEYRR